MQISTNPVPFGLQFGGNGAHVMKVPFFGTRVGGNKESNGTSTTAGHVKIDSANVSFTAVDASTSTDVNDLVIQSTASTLGVHTGEIAVVATGKSNRMDIASPIHTSSHYQTFESPFLHELIGGDRNMEQTNLVCSPDGKTWDEVTRDTSYIGGLGINTDVSASQNTVTNLLFTEWRGKIQGANSYNKGFAIAYDRVICLIPGRYRIFYSTHADSGTSSAWSEIRVNGLEAVVFYTYGSSYTNPVGECVVDLARGDFVQVLGSAKADLDCQSIFNIQQV
jgi:hypothetical protein